MSEKEKMLNGKLYNSNVDELLKERLYAKDVIFEFNMLLPSEKIKRNQIIKGLFGKIQSNFHIESPFYCDYGYNIDIGENFYANHDCIILDCAKVTIGDNVMFGPSVHAYTAGHPVHFEVRNMALEYAFPITIGNNVWIGGNSVINPGITIGNNVVIGSGSVVTKDIPSNTIAVGNPCKVIRKITEKDKKFYFKNLRIED